MKKYQKNEYCTDVISNINNLLEEGYVYLEFYKSPIKPKGSESYDIEALDLIKELEAIPKIIENSMISIEIFIKL